MSSLVPYQPPQTSGVDTDEQLLELWLLDKQSELTRQKYRSDIEHFRKWIDYLPLRQVTLPHLRQYEQTLQVGHARKMRVLACIKSLLTFGERIGYLPWNVGKAIQLQKVADQRARRYLSEEQVLTMLAGERNKRNHAIIRLLYSAALRVSELCALRWMDVIDRPDIRTGQIIVWGKGAKERAIVLSSGTYQELRTLQGTREPHDLVFVSQQPDPHGASLDQSQVFRIVEKAATRVGITGNVSPHWLRHSHASHYMARKGNVEVLRQTLGHESLTTTTLYAHALPDDSSSLGLVL